MGRLWVTLFPSLPLSLLIHSMGTIITFFLVREEGGLWTKMRSKGFGIRRSIRKMVYQARYWLSFCNKESLKYNDSKKVIHFPLRQKSEVGGWSKIGILFLKINQRPIFLLSHCSDIYYGIFLTYMAEAFSLMQLRSSVAMWGKEKKRRVSNFILRN